jgi:integrase/recombinase XerC
LVTALSTPPPSLGQKAAAIRSFFAFCYKRVLVATNPILKLVLPAREEKQPRFMTEPGYERQMEAVRFQMRDAVLIEMLLQMGVRLAEITRLRLQDVQLLTVNWLDIFSPCPG